jgi:outer membrane receptor protein involved in Fe transport
VGGNWQVFDDLRFRGTRSHDVRAPNISELFQGGTGSSNTSVFDPKANNGAGGTVQVRQIGSGNLSLKPERAETWTGGFVYQPSWLKGFAQSVDYYSIHVADVISSIGAPTLVTGCNAGNQLYCQNVVFNPNGTINFVNSPSLNLNSLKTSGIDFETSYNLSADTLVDNAPGSITARLLATYVNEDTTILPGNVVQNTVGQVSNFQRVSGVPKWTGQFSVSYDFDPWSINMRVKYVGAGIFSYALHEGTGAANTIADNSVGAVAYVDVGGSYNFAVMGMQAQLFGSIGNLLDQKPPNVPSQAAGGTNESSTNTVFYDPIGRLYKMGLRFATN